jgi:hypothetical protein
MASEFEQDVLQPQLRSSQLPESARLAHRRRSWCLSHKRLVGSVLVVLAVAGALTGFLLSSSARNPIVAVGGLVDDTACFPATLAVTSGAEYLNNRSGHPVTVTGAQPVLSTNARLTDTVIVPITGKDSIGNGVGLPTSNTQGAAELTPGDWARRQFVPVAVIPPATSDRSVHVWQLAFGLTVVHTGQRATIERVVVTFRQDGHTYHLTSNLHDVIEASGVSDSGC